MAVGKDKTRIPLTIELKDREVLKELADQDNRTVNNLIIHLIKTYIKDKTAE